ncbi:MAG: tetratricopeptide repeat protein, partial [Cyanobacteria bacterium P01_C01_bin.89]
MPDARHFYFVMAKDISDESKRYEEAIAGHNIAVKYAPNNDEAWVKRGMVLDDWERYEEAIASYDKALEINPGSYCAWHSRGIALDALDRFEEAITSYDKALELVYKVNLKHR